MVDVGVCLSGCGVYDGSEIHEAVLTLLVLDRAGARAICMAPDVQQLHVIDHRSGAVTGETRNALVESARIARGDVRDVAEAAGANEAMGSRHLECPVDEFRVDEELRIISTPAYMLAGRISEAATGIERAVRELLRLAR